MSKEIYFYQDDEDARVFLEYARSLGLEIYNYDGEKEINYFNKSDCFLNFPELNIRQNGVYKSPILIPCIMLQKNYNTLVGLQPGRLLLCCNLEKNASLALCSVFRKMKNYIKKKYSISDDKLCYMAPHIEKEWWDFKVTLVVPHKMRIVDFSERIFKIEECIDYLNSINVGVLDCGVDVHKDSPVNRKADSFVIYTDSSRLIPVNVATNNLFICESIADINKVAKTKLSLSKDYRVYSSDSECIFMHKRPRKNQPDNWRIYMDERLFGGYHTELEHIFGDIVAIIKRLENSVM